jgi:hypothetical protein
MKRINTKWAKWLTIKTWYMQLPLHCRGVFPELNGWDVKIKTPLTSVDVKNKWNHTSTPLPRPSWYAQEKMYLHLPTVLCVAGAHPRGAARLQPPKPLKPEI